MAPVLWYAHSVELRVVWRLPCGFLFCVDTYRVYRLFKIIEDVEHLASLRQIALSSVSLVD